MVIVAKNYTPLEGIIESHNAPPKREMGNLWTSIPHGELILSLGQEIQTHGGIVGEPRVVLSQDRLTMVASFPCEIPKVTVPDNGALSLGISTSNNGRYATYAYMGVVTAGGAGIPLVELIGGRKHTPTTTAQTLSLEIVDNLWEESKEINNLIHHLEKTKISDKRLQQLILKAGRDKLLPWSHLGEVDALICSTDKLKISGWDVLTAFALVAQKSPPLKQMERVFKFRELIPGW